MSMSLVRESLTHSVAALGEERQSHKGPGAGHDPSKKVGSPVPQLTPHHTHKEEEVVGGCLQWGWGWGGQLGIMWEGERG